MGGGDGSMTWPMYLGGTPHSPIRKDPPMVIIEKLRVLASWPSYSQNEPDDHRSTGPQTANASRDPQCAERKMSPWPCPHRLRGSPTSHRSPPAPRPCETPRGANSQAAGLAKPPRHPCGSASLLLDCVGMDTVRSRVTPTRRCRVDLARRGSTECAGQPQAAPWWRESHAEMRRWSPLDDSAANLSLESGSDGMPTVHMTGSARPDEAWIMVPTPVSHLLHTVSLHQEP